jgi:hypothetical protein
VNLYAFVGNSTTNQIDRLGLVIWNFEDGPPFSDLGADIEGEVPDNHRYFCRCELVVKCSCCNQKDSCGNVKGYAEATGTTVDSAIVQAVGDILFDMDRACEVLDCPTKGKKCSADSNQFAGREAELYDGSLCTCIDRFDSGG